MSYFSYIGRLDSPKFCWDEIPDAVYASAIAQPHHPSRVGKPRLRAGIHLPLQRRTGCASQQIDWGAWGWAVRKSDLEAIWQEQKWSPNSSAYGNTEWQSLGDQIGALSDDETYLLVVAENA